MNFNPYPTPPPPGYAPFDTYHRGTTPMSPGPGYYSPRYGPQTATPSPRDSPKFAGGHHRRASHAVPQQQHFSSPRGGAVPDFTSPRYKATPQRAPEFVSRDFGYAPSGWQQHHRPRCDRDVDDGDCCDFDATPLKRSHRERKRRPSQPARYSTRARVVFDGYEYDDDDVYGHAYDRVYDHPPPPYEPYARYTVYDMYGNADHYARRQVPIFDPEPKASRPRRASHAARPQPPPAQQQTPKRPAPAKAAPSKATEEDARRAGIPAGYSYKNWDPTEEPILLLGSVFDANSLGKWIYDWTVFHYGSATPIAEMAGELWLLLIQLAGKVKRAEETMPKIRKQASREMVDAFLDSGERLWIRFAKLLKVCEDYMWKAAKKETGEKKPLSMGKNSGCEFVNSIFGRDRELEKTEKLMTGMRLWSMRFDANCDDILRHPTA